MICEFQEKFDWKNISWEQKLSEEFIRETKLIVCIFLLNKKLSEYFIREYIDKVNWVRISINQSLSEDFIRHLYNFKMKLIGSIFQNIKLYLKNL